MTPGLELPLVIRRDPTAGGNRILSFVVLWILTGSVLGAGAFGLAAYVLIDLLGVAQATGIPAAGVLGGCVLLATGYACFRYYFRRFHEHFRLFERHFEFHRRRGEVLTHTYRDIEYAFVPPDHPRFVLKIRDRPRLTFADPYWTPSLLHDAINTMAVEDVTAFIRERLQEGHEVHLKLPSGFLSWRLLLHGLFLVICLWMTARATFALFTGTWSLDGLGTSGLFILLGLWSLKPFVIRIRAIIYGGIFLNSRGVRTLKRGPILPWSDVTYVNYEAGMISLDGVEEDAAITCSDRVAHIAAFLRVAKALCPQAMFSNELMAQCECGYVIEGLESTRCPECGAEL